MKSPSVAGRALNNAKMKGLLNPSPLFPFCAINVNAQVCPDAEPTGKMSLCECHTSLAYSLFVKLLFSDTIHITTTDTYCNWGQSSHFISMLDKENPLPKPHILLYKSLILANIHISRPLSLPSLLDMFVALTANSNKPQSDRSLILSSQNT